MCFPTSYGRSRTLPLTPPKCGSKKQICLNKFPYNSVIDKARDFEFGKQLGFASNWLPSGLIDILIPNVRRLRPYK